MANDGELLRRYAECDDESAFGQLVERHGPMVQAACERLAGPDADDAMQAVFLLLARKAARLAGCQDVGLWLHSACRFVARTALRERSRRTAREKEAAAMQEAGIEPRVSESERREMREHLDSAVAALPERFREVVLLCHLEGASQQEAADRLGLPLGTVASRARRGLERLRRRLARHGAALNAAALAGLLAEGAAKAAAGFNAPALLSSVMAASKVSAAGAAAAAAGASGTALGAKTGAAILAKGAMQAMFWSKVKFAAAAVAAVTVLGSSVPLTVVAVQGAELQKGGAAIEAEPAAPPQADAPEGDPGVAAVKQYGTVMSAEAGAPQPLTPTRGSAGRWGPTILGGEPAPPPPAPVPGGGARVMVFTGEQRSGSGKVTEKEVLRATAAADVIAVVKVSAIEDLQAEKKADPKAAGAGARVGVGFGAGFGGMMGKDKKVSGEVDAVLRGSEGLEKLDFLVKVRERGKQKFAVFAKKTQIDGPAGGTQVFTRSTSVPFTLAAGKKSLVFLKLESEKKDEEGKVTERVYRLLPPMINGAPRKTLASVRAALKTVKEWESDPKLTAEQVRKIDDLIGRLDDDDFQTRENATKELIATGRIVRGKVRAALKHEDAETRTRAGQILEKLKPEWLKPEKGPESSTGPGGATIIQGNNGGRVKIQMKVRAGQ